MRKAFAPYSLHADAQIYFPTKSNTGDAHIMAMQAGGVMQKNDNHAATVHLEAGAGSYGSACERQRRTFYERRRQHPVQVLL